MAEKTRKPDRPRETPRNLPAFNESRHGTKSELLDGGHLEDTIFSDLDLSAVKLSELKGCSLLFERVSFANCEIDSLNLVDTRLIGCDLSNAVLRRFEATRVEFLDCKLIGMNAFACCWEDVLIDHCETRLAGVDLSACEIEGITLRVEDLRGAIVSAPQAMELARLLEVVIK